MPQVASQLRISDFRWRTCNGFASILGKQWPTIERKVIRILESYESTRYTYYSLNLIVLQKWRPLAATWCVYICMLIDPVAEFDLVIEEVQDYLCTVSPHLAVNFLSPHMWEPVEDEEDFSSIGTSESDDDSESSEDVASSEDTGSNDEIGMQSSSAATPDVPAGP